MPDLSQPKKPTYRRGTGADPTQGQMPYGAAQNLNEKSAVAAGGSPPPFPDVNPGGGFEEEQTEPLLGGDFDSVLFQPTHRPNEPLTEGAPFGAGANSIRSEDSGETDRERLLRIAESMVTHPAVGSASKALLARIARGE